MSDRGLCDRCDGNGYREKYREGSGIVRVRCFACHGTGRWHRSDERWPYATAPSPDR